MPQKFTFKVRTIAQLKSNTNPPYPPLSKGDLAKQEKNSSLEKEGSGEIFEPNDAGLIVRTSRPVHLDPRPYAVLQGEPNAVLAHGEVC
jgi:hypothetical protein